MRFLRVFIVLLSFFVLLIFTLFGILFIFMAIGLMLLASSLRRDSEAVPLPEVSVTVGPPIVIEPDTLNRVEVTPETVQAVIADLSRPDVYSRDVVIESYWEGGYAKYIIDVSVKNDLTSLRTTPPVGIEKRIIVTPNSIYIWYRGDRTPYIGVFGDVGDGYRTADEWQMLITYEDVLKLDKKDIINAGYVVYKDEECVYVVHSSPLLRNTIMYYISLNHGLVIGAEEFDESDNLIYSMSSGGQLLYEVSPAAFVLPDGIDLGTINT